MAERPVQTVEAFWLQDRPVYRLVYESTAWLVDAANGKSVLVDSVIASGIAAEDYAGNGVASEPERSEEHTSELQSLMRISYAVFCLKKKKTRHDKNMER